MEEALILQLEALRLEIRALAHGVSKDSPSNTEFIEGETSHDLEVLADNKAHLVASILAGPRSTLP